jgi:hypothetical protein
MALTSLILSIVAMTYVPTAFAQERERVNIYFDKGTVELTYVETLATPYEYTYRMEDDCRASIKETSTRSQVSVTHTSESCPRGTNFVLRVRRGADLRLSLGGGVIRVRGSDRILREFSEVEAVSSGGVVQSDVSGWDSLVPYGTASARKENEALASAPQLDIRVGGGVIHFQR